MAGFAFERAIAGFGFAAVLRLAVAADGFAFNRVIAGFDLAAAARRPLLADGLALATTLLRAAPADFAFEATAFFAAATRERVVAAGAALAVDRRAVVALVLVLAAGFAFAAAGFALAIGAFDFAVLVAERAAAAGFAFVIRFGFAAAFFIDAAIAAPHRKQALVS